MTDADVLAFVPRPPPELASCELRLNDDFSIEMVVCDDAGAVVATLDYALVGRPEGFDLDRLTEAWSRWRAASAVAS